MVCICLYLNCTWKNVSTYTRQTFLYLSLQMLKITETEVPFYAPLTSFQIPRFKVKHSFNLRSVIANF